MPDTAIELLILQARGSYDMAEYLYRAYRLRPEAEVSHDKVQHLARAVDSALAFCNLAFKLREEFGK
jgi:hypothetical protein